MYSIGPKFLNNFRMSVSEQYADKSPRKSVVNEFPNKFDMIHNNRWRSARKHQPIKLMVVKLIACLVAWAGQNLGLGWAK
jgi:hypothetical protein